MVERGRRGDGVAADSPSEFETIGFAYRGVAPGLIFLNDPVSVSSVACRTEDS